MGRRRIVNSMTVGLYPESSIKYLDLMYMIFNLFPLPASAALSSAVHHFTQNLKKRKDIWKTDYEVSEL